MQKPIDWLEWTDTVENLTETDPNPVSRETSKYSQGIVEQSGKRSAAKDAVGRSRVSEHYY